MEIPVVERERTLTGPRTVVPREVVARTSLERGQMPSGGAYDPPFRWDDLLDKPPPRRHTRGEGAYVVFHGLEAGPDVRLSYATVVSVDPGDDPDTPLDDVIHVDSRIGVQRRAFFELLDRERAFTERFTSRWRERLGRRLVRQRALANRIRILWLRTLVIKLIRLQAKITMGLIRRTRRTMRALAEFPDDLVTRSLRAQAHLGGRFGRRTMWAGLKDPSTLTTEQKSVVMFLSLGAILTLVLLLNTFFALVLPGHAGLYRSVFADASVSLVGVLAFPIPIEPLIISSTLALGPVLGFTGFFVGKMVGVWLLYFLGDSLYDVVAKRTAGKPRTARVVHWMQSNANRFGFALLVPINALPLVPDFLLYAFCVSGMRFRPYWWGIVVGTVVKFGGIIVGVLIVGPERVQAFLEDPFP